MDDLNEKLNRLLSDPEGLAKIQAAMSALGGGETPPSPPPPAPAPPAAEEELRPASPWLPA